MDATWEPILRQAMGGRQLNERQQQIANGAHARIQAPYREQLQWRNLEPTMVRVYQNSFSQKDVDGMTAF